MGVPLTRTPIGGRMPDDFQTFQFGNVFCLRPKDFAKAYGVSCQTLANWRVNRSDGPIFIKEGGSVLYPIEANFDRLRHIPHCRSTSSNRETGGDAGHSQITDFAPSACDHVSVAAS